MSAAAHGPAPRGAAHPLVAVYADESCLGNGRAGDNPGGAGGLVEYVRAESGELVRHDYWVSEPSTTNNRMALRSAIEVFRALSAKERSFSVVFTSDSKYLVDGMREWVHGWARRGWRRQGGEIENRELWFEAIRAVGAHHVDWRWVRGHNGNAQNEYANHLATRAAAQQSRSDGLVPSEFESWVAAQRARGSLVREPDAFPEAHAFRHVPLPPVAAGRQ